MTVLHMNDDKFHVDLQDALRTLFDTTQYSDLCMDCAMLATIRWAIMNIILNSEQEDRLDTAAHIIERAAATIDEAMTLASKLDAGEAPDGYVVNDTAQQVLN